MGREGLEEYLLGGTTDRIIRRSDVPVLTIPHEMEAPIEYPYRDVMVPTDGSDCADHALSAGIDVAKNAAVALHLVSVIAHSAPELDPGAGIQTSKIADRANEVVESAKATTEEAGIGAVFESVEEGPSVSEAIVAYVDEQDIDLVVMGTHGRTRFDRYALGSITKQLVRTAPVPVLTVRPPEVS